MAGKAHSVLQTELHFHVRPLIMRFVVNALALGLTVWIVPHVAFSGDHRILSWLVISIVFGLLNAFLKPLLQLLMLPLIFVSYGLIVVLINTLLLYVLSWIFPDNFHVERLLWAFVGGLVCGFLETLFINLFGLTPPIVEGGPANLKKQLAASKRGLLETELAAVVAEKNPGFDTQADRNGDGRPDGGGS
jgi:putative membrane protein